MPTVLLTRPEAASRRFAARLDGLTVVIAPLLRIVPVDHDTAALAAATGLVLTSENAVPAAGPGAGRPAICVGPRTTAAARAAGFAVTEGPGDAAGMLPMLKGLAPGWLHPHGRHVAARLPVPGVVVYDQEALPLTDEARLLLSGDGPVILPLFSPRSARLAADATAGASAPLWLAAISPAARATFGTAAAREVIAAQPNADSMVQAIRALLAAERGRPADS